VVLCVKAPYTSNLVDGNDVSEKHTPPSLPVFLYGCETWSLTLREEQRLTMFENRVLRIFGLKRDDMTGG
jgi:hypothetical protein